MIFSVAASPPRREIVASMSMPLAPMTWSVKSPRPAIPRRERATDRRVLRSRRCADRSTTRRNAEAEVLVASRFDDEHFDERLRRPHVDLRDGRA